MAFIVALKSEMSLLRRNHESAEPCDGFIQYHHLMLAAERSSGSQDHLPNVPLARFCGTMGEGPRMLLTFRTLNRC